MEWRLKAGILEPEKKSIATQRLCKHVPAATNLQRTIERFLETVFSVGTAPRLYNEDNPLTYP
jgi:hypothetical protein